MKIIEISEDTLAKQSKTKKEEKINTDHRRHTECLIRTDNHILTVLTHLNE